MKNWEYYLREHVWVALYGYMELEQNNTQRTTQVHSTQYIVDNSETLYVKQPLVYSRQPLLVSAGLFSEHLQGVEVLTKHPKV